MNPKRLTEAPADVRRRLLADGWSESKGKGDHVNFRKPGHRVVTVDMGVREIPIGTLRNIYRIADWTW